MSKTTMGEALKAVGMNPAEYRLAAAIHEFMKQGGTVERAHALVDEAAKRIPGEGQDARASDGHTAVADARQQVEGEEANDRLPQGHVENASSPSLDRGGEGHVGGAQSRQQPTALPVREPSPAFRAASLESRKDAARSVLYKHRTSTGQWWGDVHPYEVAAMARDTIRGTALMAAAGALNAKQMQMTFSQLLAPKLAEIAMDKADKELANVR